MVSVTKKCVALKCFYDISHTLICKNDIQCYFDTTGTLLSTVTRKAAFPKQPSNYTVTEVDSENCPECERPVFKEEKASRCMHCKKCTHSQCGTTYKSFRRHVEDNLGGCLCVQCAASPSIFLCYQCGTRKLNAERYRKRAPIVSDSDLTKSWSQQIHQRTLTQEERDRRKNSPVKKKDEKRSRTRN